MGPRASSRLVSGLPALQQLMQAQLAASRLQQDARSPDLVPARVAGLGQAAHAVADAIPAPPVTTATPPTLAVPSAPADLLADAELLDRLTEEIEDRLEERWREQAIRHLGTTSGVL
ncbi:MAG: hypothetical protein RL722_1061 [Pseudomonadota bacterium]|jgi:hypothetical protein